VYYFSFLAFLDVSKPESYSGGCTEKLFAEKSVYLSMGDFCFNRSRIRIFFLTAHSTKRLIVKLDHPPQATAADEILLSHWEEKLPEIKDYIEQYDGAHWSTRNSFAALMTLVRQKKDRRLAFSVAKAFTQLHYDNDSRMVRVFQETAKTLAVLDKDTAAIMLKAKLQDAKFWQDIAFYVQRDIVPDFINAIMESQDATAVDWVFNEYMPYKSEQIVDEIKITREDLDKHGLSDFHTRLMRIAIEQGKDGALDKLLNEKNMEFLFWELASDDSHLRFNAGRLFEYLGAPEFEYTDVHAYKQWWMDHKSLEKE